MNKTHTLALLSSLLLLVISAFGGTKEKEDIRLDDMETPKEVSVDAPKKTPNPFLKQEKKLVKHFDTKKSNDVFALDKEGPFMDVDPWDD